MIPYTIACTFNVLLDFVMTYITAYKIFKGLDFHTYFGIPIEHVTSFTDRVESYAMQQLLADDAFGYLFPSILGCDMILMCCTFNANGNQ